MMIRVMAYALVVSAALTVAGHCIERIAGLYRRPRRTAWIAMMVLSIALPALAVFASSALVNQAGMAPAQPQSAAAPGRPDGTAGAPRAPIWQVATPSDGQVLGMWTIASAAFAFYLLCATSLLRMRASRWQRARVLGTDVLVSDAVGPALLGVWRPRIVVPRWLLNQPMATQRLILEHERQHMAARDPQMMLAGLCIIAAFPWNPFLWWQWWRMRQAIEADCDARVLRGGVEADEYAGVLIDAASRAARIFPGALAMSEPVTALERRIRLLIPDEARFRGLQVAGMVILAAVVGGASLAMDAPAVSITAAATVPRPAQPSPAPLARPTPESIIAENDLDQDGVVTRQEAEEVNTNLAVMWTVYDADHDDRIDIAEFTRIAQDMRVGAALEAINGDRGGHMAPARPELIISINDHNGDGVVTREEANHTGRALMRMWDSFDLDKDGKVDVAEAGRAQGR